MDESSLDKQFLKKINQFFQKQYIKKSIHNIYNDYKYEFIYILFKIYCIKMISLYLYAIE